MLPYAYGYGPLYSGKMLRLGAAISLAGAFPSTQLKLQPDNKRLPLICLISDFDVVRGIWIAIHGCVLVSSIAMEVLVANGVRFRDRMTHPVRLH